MIYGEQSRNIVLISDTIPANVQNTCKTRTQQQIQADIDLYGGQKVRYSDMEVQDQS